MNYFKKISILALTCLSVLSANSYAAEKYKCSETPTTVTKNFYTWYMKSIDAEKHPLTDDVDGIKKFITNKLFIKLNKELSSPEGMSEDYFMKAQDYDNDWITKIKVTTESYTNMIAKEVVVLGNTKDTIQTLKVNLKPVDGCWKINAVNQ